MGPGCVLTIVTASVATGLMSKNKLAIPVCVRFPTMTHSRPIPFTGLLCGCAVVFLTIFQI